MTEAVTYPVLPHSAMTWQQVANLSISEKFVVGRAAVEPLRGVALAFQAKIPRSMSATAAVIPVATCACNPIPFRSNGGM